MSEAFAADHRLRLTLGWILAIAMPLVVLSHLHSAANAEGTLGLLELSAAIAGVGVSACLVWGLIQRRRPIVEVFDDRVEAMLMYQLVGRKVIPFADIADVSLSGHRLRLAKPSGEVVTIKLASLSETSRQRVVQAIERRLRPRSG
jgi:hypothetical protein